MPPVSYDRAQIVDWLDVSTVAKGQAYVRAAFNIRWSDDTLSGKVQGTQHRPYSVEARFEQDDGDVWVDGECSCPVGYNCKHVAALLLAGMSVAAPSPAGVRSEVVKWLEGFQSRHRRAAPTLRKPQPTQALGYVIAATPRGRPSIFLYKVRLAADGSIRSIDAPWNNLEAALVRPMKFIQEEDLPILRGLLFGRLPEDYGSFVLRGTAGAELLEKLVATGRLVTVPGNGSGTHVQALRRGAARPGSIEWETQPQERLRCVLRTDPPCHLLVGTVPFWYVDATSAEAGVVDYPGSVNAVADVLAMPAISLEEAPLVGAVLRDIAPDLPPPPAHDRATLRLIDCDPIPVLRFDSVPVYGLRVEPRAEQLLDVATLSFDYGGVVVAAHSDTTLHRNAGGEVIQLKRRAEAEHRRLQELREAGLQRLDLRHVYSAQSLPVGILGLKDAAAWSPFMSDAVPRLRALGWRCAMSDAFRFNVIPIETIDGSVRPTAEGWFDLDMGIQVGDRSVRLEPLLRVLFQRDSRWLSGQLDTIGDAEPIELTTDRGERLRLRGDRLKPLVRVLIDLFDAASSGEGSLRIGKWDAVRLGALEDLGRWQFHGAESIRQLARRLSEGAGVAAVPLPRGLRVELRDYQRQGFHWLQFLRQNDLAGVLADDMGLGKTVQALTHILAEQEAGRLDRPALVVMPTSLIHNWREEAARFTPTLRVLDLQGTARKERFDAIPGHELILTTYALLWRDYEALAQHRYHLLLLDESQYVKNAATKTAAAIRRLDARHRLCLTGTPLENHLGELWSQFDFLLPGFLGTQKDFNLRWRTPIEKRGDAVRRDLLARRLRPFLLRRRKDEVARELPSKTTIVRSVDLEGAQRDLYETVRSAMQARVRAAVSAQGLARSHIIVLDALLKLRQVCCDPRLVQLEKAKGIRESSKLALLLEMLPALLEEGRRILVFSQFASMLALIGAALEAAGIRHVSLTGETTDRAAPIRQFERGEAAIFLISLKAGGVGLNLTSADTVIHYDPWWNPATENQATDRAHRLGQTKPVFVYKLVVAGSIEEKILELQAKKAALADLILSDDPAKGVKFSPGDLEALFAPLP
jgi:superfamily II DNA or RNA helicase